ncbi:MAG: META domain-containing protein [Pyrinomonadaceae bacterium]|nr:META domain-containing protein [Acidobacteriota bacterium]MBK7932316.1 META domain-containing protein [Acidobacteriota bacterium]MBP7376403.1 META domain-containing protein [Pyrinomonadaceae bacterium]
MRKIIKSAIITMISISIISTTAISQSLPQGKWRLESYNFMQKIAYPIDKNTITLNIHEEGKLGGKSGCNVYGGNYSMEDGELSITGIISTMMACEEPSMQFEQTFFRTLEGAKNFELSNGKLTITNAVTANFLRFVRVKERHKCQPSIKVID